MRTSMFLLPTLAAVAGCSLAHLEPSGPSPSQVCHLTVVNRTDWRCSVTIRHTERATWHIDSGPRELVRFVIEPRAAFRVDLLPGRYTMECTELKYQRSRSDEWEVSPGQELELPLMSTRSVSG